MLKREDRPFVLACAVFVGLVLAMAWLSPWPSYPNENQYEAYSAQQEAAYSHLSASEISRRASEHEDYEKAITDWWMIRLTTSLVLVGFIQFIMFWLQWLLLRASVADTTLAANAATRQAIAAENALRVVERSYISADNWLITQFVPGLPPGRTGVTFQLINSGRIPAEIIESRLGYKIGFDIPETPDYSQGFQVGHSVIRPFGNSTQPIRFPTSVTAEEFEKTILRDWCIFVWGEVQYTDNFGDDVHRTGFGAKAVYQFHVDNVAMWQFEFIHHPKYTYST